MNSLTFGQSTYSTSGGALNDKIDTSLNGVHYIWSCSHKVIGSALHKDWRNTSNQFIKITEEWKYSLVAALIRTFTYYTRFISERKQLNNTQLLRMNAIWQRVHPLYHHETSTNHHYSLKKLVSFPCPAISFFLFEALLTVLPGILTETLVGCFFCGGSFSDPPCWSESTCFLLLPLLCICMPVLFLLPRPAPLFWAFPLLGPRAAPRCTPLCSLFGHSEVGLAGKIETKQKQVWQPGRKNKTGKMLWRNCWR